MRGMDHDPGTTGPLAALAEPVAPALEGVASSRWRRLPVESPHQGVVRSIRSTQLATVVHWVTVFGAFAFWARLDRRLWFFGDEWDFLVRRGLAYAPTNPWSIWFPHNEHWSTLPVLLWRGLYNVFHLSSYWPYMVPLLLTAAGVMHMAWRLCHRAGVDPWVATAAAGVLGFLGAGAEDLTSAFQIGFVASVLFGLIALDQLAWPAGATKAHDLQEVRRTRLRRDALASVALLASLMCSAIGIAMVAGAAVLVFSTRPVKRAAGVLVLPAASYLIWFAFVGRLGLTSPADHVSQTTLTTLPGYVWFGLSSALGTAFNLPSAGPALLVGLATWVGWHMRRRWREGPLLLALCVAAASFYTVAALGRDTTVGAGTVVSRYVYVGIAILLPVIASILSSVKVWRPARLAVIGLLIVTAVGNIGQARTWAESRVAVTSSLKTELVATAQLLGSGTHDVSGPAASPIGLYPDLSAGDIQRLERSGQLPHGALTPVDVANARALLAVGTWNDAKTALSRRPLFAGHFALVKVERSAAPVVSNGCVDFSPETISPPMQVWLRLTPGETAASVRLSTATAAPGVTNYVAAVLAPSRGPSSTVPVELAVPDTGTGYLSDNDAQADVVLLWDVGAPLALCGLAST